MNLKQHYAPLIRLGLPIVIGQLGMIILGFADTIMVGRHSSAELSAAGFVNNIFNLAIITGMGFSYGLTPVVSSRHGAADAQGVARAFRASLPANTLTTLLLMAVLTVLYLNLHRIGQPDELLPLMRPYYVVLLASLLPLMWFNAFKQFADGVMDTRTPMWILLMGNVVNIVGNALLIFGLGGLPELGLLGAGLATLISRLIMVVAAAIVFCTSKRYEAYRTHFLHVRTERRELLTLNRLGWPIALQMGMETASFSLCAVMMGWIGATALAAHQVMCTISSLCFMVYYGIGAAVSIRVGYFHGQHDVRGVSSVTRAGLHLIALVGITACTLIWLTRHSLGQLFTTDPAVSALVATMVIPMLLYQIGDALQITYANALRGIACVRRMMLFAFIAYFLVSLPASWLFGFTLSLGAVGVWMGLPFGLTTAGLLFRWEFWRKLR